MKNELSKKYVLVTGTSTGLGAFTSKSLLDHGYSVIATIRNKNHLPEWARELSPQLSQNLTWLELDMKRTESIAQLSQQISELLSNQLESGLYGVINNAGICVAGPLEMITESDLTEQMRVNWLGPILLLQHLLPLLRKSGGRIINIGSAAGKIALPFLGAYASSKYAMEAWSDSLRRELADQKIPVTLLQVGSIATPIWQKLALNAQTHLQPLQPSRPLQPSDPQQRIADYYSHSMNQFLELNHQEALKRKTTPGDVSAIIVKVLAMKSPPSRLPIGLDAKLNSFFSKIIPDSILDFLIVKMIKASVR